jgi:UDP-glucose 4-epimerase
MNYPIEGAHVLVTGGAGCLGSTIVDRLLELDAGRVDVLDDMSEGYTSNLEACCQHPNFGAIFTGNLAKTRYVKTVIQDHDYVIHCGGHLLLKAQADGHAAIDTNIHGTLNVLEACEAAGVKKVVFTSSISIFGEPRYTPVDECHPLDNTTIYGATKIAGEHLCREFGRSGLPYSIIRPYNIYGPRQSPKNGAFSQVVPRWIRCIMRDQPIVIHGDGSQTMDLVHVADMAEAHVLALVWGRADGEAFNIGTGVATSARELAERLVQEFGVPDHPIQYVPQDVNLVKMRCCDIDKARRVLGYEPRFDVETGIRSTVAWWRMQAGG